MRALLLGLVLVGCADPRKPPLPQSTRAPTVPARDAAVWVAIEGKHVTCPGGDEYTDCVRVQLPAAGFVDVEGTTPHGHGCVDLDGGAIDGAIGRGVVELRMTLAGSSPGNEPCRALARLTGRGVVGPLAAGDWLLRPVDPPDGFAPLHLGALRFAPVR